MYPTAVKQRFQFGLQPTLAWVAMLGLVGFSLVCVVVGAGSILRLAYPLASFGVALLLYQRYSVLYVGFTWWVCFLSPFLRRLIDLKSGWLDPNPVLLAPFLVMLVSGMTLIRYLPIAYRLGGLPFLLSMMGAVYGLLVGIIKNSPMAVVVPSLNWIAPLLFGFHLFANWRYYPAYRQNIQRTFLWGVLVTGLYGVFQYLTAPEWDRFWLINTNAIAFGVPEPLGMRVFSTMNSPGPFANVMMAGLILLFSSHSVIRFIAAGAGYLAFLLTLVRSAWLGWIVAVITFIPSLRPKLQMRLIITILVMAIAVLPLTAIEPFSTAITSRIGSFSNAHNDVSYNQRLEGYSEILTNALTEVSGNGFGFVLVNKNIGSNDSGILTTLFTLGWFGAIPYVGGIILLLFTLLQSAIGKVDPFFSAARAIAVGVFSQIGLGDSTLALSGVIFWGFAGIALSAKCYYHSLSVACHRPISD